MECQYLRTMAIVPFWAPSWRVAKLLEKAAWDYLKTG